MSIRAYTSQDFDAWNGYVDAHEASNFFQYAEWYQIIAEGSGQTPRYLLSEAAGRITGILPVFTRSSLLFGRAASSVPFGVYGGPLADDHETALALMEAAAGSAFASGIPSIEYKLVHLISGAEEAGWSVGSNAATFIRPLAQDDEAELLAIPRKQRAVVRKALKNNLTIKRGSDQFDIFYALYAESVRNLGTPVFPKKLLRLMMQVFDASVDVLVVYTAEGNAIASCMSFIHKDTIMPYYAGGSPVARRYGAHDYMYFDLMRFARERSLAQFDFGRSREGTGPYAFKKNWGFEPHPLPYAKKEADGTTARELDPKSGKFEKLVKVWKRLPLPIANLVGPHLSKHLG